MTSLRDGAALANVKVSVIKVDEEGAATEAAATTAADGTFSLPGLPAGTSYRVRFALDGFVARFREVAIPASAGDYPQGNGVGEADIALAPATGGISGKIFGDNARAAVGAKIGIDLRPANYDFVTEVVADASGNYSFVGLPGAPTGVPVTLVLQPYDQDKDGQADYDVMQVSSLAFPDVTTRTDIDLRTAANALVLLSSDLDDGEHPSAEVMRFVFNRALVPDRLEVSLTDLDTSRSVGVSAALDSGGSRLVVSVAGGKLAEGTDYRLNIEARGTNGSAETFTRNFRAVSGSSALLPAVTNFTVTPDEVDWTTTTFNLEWDMVTGAAAYRIYVRDTKANPAFVLLKTVGAGLTPQTTVTLPEEFDTFSGDGRQTPFAFGTGVEIAIVAENAVGEAPPPGATYAQKADNVQPKILSAYQTDGADNSTGSSDKNIELRLSFNEYMDANQAPELMAPAGVLSVFEADPNLMGGKFIISIPAGVNATGAYTINGGADTSGQPLITYDGNLTAVTQLLSNGGFEGCSLAGWTTSVSGTAGAPVAVSEAAATGTCSARLGAVSGSSTTQGGTSAIWQQVTLPTGVSAITFSARYMAYSNGPYAHDYPYCQLQSSTGAYLTQLWSDYYTSTTFQTATASLTAYAGQTVRLYCASYQDGVHTSGVYFDDLQITVTP